MTDLADNIIEIALVLIFIGALFGDSIIDFVRRLACAIRGGKEPKP